MTNGAGSDIVGDFRLGLDLMKRYPVMAAPPLIAMAIVFVLMAIVFGGTMTMFAVGGAAGGAGGLAGAMVGGALLFGVIGILGMLVNLVASAVVIMMAREALAGREPSMPPALAAVNARLGDVVLASILVALIVFVAFLFFVFPAIIAAFFLMFTLPAVLVDGRGAVEAVRRSATLVKDNVGPVIGLVIGAVVAMVVVAIVSKILGIVPFIGPLASMLLGGAFFAYLTVVVVRVYETLPRR